MQLCYCNMHSWMVERTCRAHYRYTDSTERYSTVYDAGSEFGLQFQKSSKSFVSCQSCLLTCVLTMLDKRYKSINL